MSNKNIAIEINGEKIPLPENSTISYTLNLLGITSKNIAAELDGEIVISDNFDTTVLRDGAKLEIVRFVGGG